MLKLQTLKAGSCRKARKRVGRGNGNNWGRTCGRGDKGQKSRSGYSRRPYFEGGQIPLFRRLPKRGFNHPNRTEFALVNLIDLERNFENGEIIDGESLKRKGMIGKSGDNLKVLGKGDVSKSFTVKAVRFSNAAKSKIEAAGGTCEII
jgi:large subunit ribosomal protein L15